MFLIKVCYQLTFIRPNPRRCLRVGERIKKVSSGPYSPVDFVTVNATAYLKSACPRNGVIRVLTVQISWLAPIVDGRDIFTKFHQVLIYMRYTQLYKQVKNYFRRMLKKVAESDNCYIITPTGDDVDGISAALGTVVIQF